MERGRSSRQARAPWVIGAACRASLFVLYTSITSSCRWELGFGSGRTCQRQLGRWQRVGVVDAVHRMLLAEL